MSSPDEDKQYSKRPKDTAFKQQRLPAWQPIMTASSVLPVFFAIGIIFIPLGIGLLITSNNVRETIKDYTNCAPTNPGINYSSCAEYLLNNPGADDCECNVAVTLSQEYLKPVYIYYGLSNFYQNHRRYVKSRDDIQLKGSVSSPSALDSNCEPFRLYNNSIGYAPCGAIANSLFNDSMSLTYTKDGNDVSVGLLNTGIAWDTDRDVKFGNPSNFASNGSGFANFIQPPNWHIPVYQLDLNNSNNNGFDNEDLIVWMRTAALPNFRKFYRRIDHSMSTFTDSLPAGTYNFTIKYNFPVTMFSGTKRVIISTTSWLGGKNPFLGVAYIVVGSICVLLGFVFVVIHVRIGKNPSELIQNVNSRTPF